MSYRHEDHAGNFADVHKHCLLVQVLSLLQRISAPLLYVDTHAGAGLYALDLSPVGRERLAWIGGLGAAADCPEPVRHWLEVAATELQAARYPGSPLLADRLLRSTDRAEVIEQRVYDAALLARHLKGSRRSRVRAGDGFRRLGELLPPTQPHGLVLIDPPYVDRNEFDLVPPRLDAAWRLWPASTVLAWYPRLDDQAHLRLHRQLLDLPPAPILDTWIERGEADSPLCGSGLLVINPPVGLVESWRPANAWLAGQLAGPAEGRRAGTDWLVAAP